MPSLFTPATPSPVPGPSTGGTSQIVPGQAPTMGDTSSFSQSFGSALGALGSGIPQGLSQGQKSTLYARAQTLAGRQGKQEVSNLAQRFGGDVTNPQFQRLSTMARTISQSVGASRVADIGIEESRRDQALETQRRQQLLGLTSIGAQAASTNVQAALERIRLELGERGQEQQFALGRGQLGVAREGQRASLMQSLISSPNFAAILKGLAYRGGGDGRVKFDDLFARIKGIFK